ncbi:MAG: hypothetical protein LRY75_12060 [Shewanella xiamenensis]|uniref:hypothetical protein n=1 Tax=Shewanella TaxID=22 RepID=UPI0006D9CEEC|nr:hypothetical protein [Shewanella sp. Sh95]KPN78323.1 hypothetical protein AEA42_03610 [Shewanella sp. Sh95]MCD8551740.1 hypothetical protein [Shewanella xiamenensis]MCD8559520.1 hypothetical protein [Shewanella xiamenensis]
MKLNYAIFAIVGFCGIFFTAKAHANTPELPACSAVVCEKVFLDEKHMQATLFVWTGDAKILHSYTFELKNKISFDDISTNIKELKVGTLDSSVQNLPPPAAPCKSGVCASVLQETFQTMTQMVTVSLIFIHLDGELVSVSSVTNEQT